MSIIAWVALGAAAGYLASTRRRDEQSALRPIALGIVGALVGGFTAAVLLHANPISGPLDLASTATALLGAIAAISGANAIGAKHHYA